MKFSKAHPEVFYNESPVVQVTDRDIQWLIEVASNNARKRSRICTHLKPNDALHEMLIVHFEETYVRPHRHLFRPESFHVISGEADVVLFDDSGGITEVVQVGPYGSAKTFYYRLAEPIFHSMLIRTPVFVFHEVTSGPFDTHSTEFPAWAPEASDEAVHDYRCALQQQIAQCLKK